MHPTLTTTAMGADCLALRATSAPHRLFGLPPGHGAGGNMEYHQGTHVPHSTVAAR